MLKLLFLALIPIVFGQFQDPCVLNPCTKPTEVCLRRDSNERLCIEQRLFQTLLASGLPSQPSMLEATVQQQEQQQQQQKPQQQKPQQQPLPTQRVGNFVQQTQQLPVSRSSILPNTDRQPVLILNDKPKQKLPPVPPAPPVLPVLPVSPVPPVVAAKQPSHLDNLRRGNFVSLARGVPVVTPTEVKKPPSNLPIVPRTTFAQSSQQQQQFQQGRVVHGNVGFARNDAVSMQPLAPTSVKPNLPSRPQVADDDNRPISTFSVTDICRGAINGQQFPYPFDNSQFIICSPPGGSVLSCPQGLRFSTYKNRCEYTDAEPAPACLSSPCQNNGVCTNFPNYKYRCECQDGFAGEQCEKVQTVCSLNPCGPRGVCHTFGFATASAQYYCVCDNARSYSLTDCNRDIIVNPCLSTSAETFLSVPTHEDLFVHCFDNAIHLKACSPSLIWSPSILACDYKF